MDKNLVKKYKKDEMTIIWKPGNCVHAGACVKALPLVYNPAEKPWIKPENASIEALQKQIKSCPSGALSYEMNGKVEATETSEPSKIVVAPDGPLMVHGSVAVTLADGTVEHKEKLTAFCRCGHSANKPYCDGKHKKEGFKG